MKPKRRCAPTADQLAAEAFFAARARPNPRLRSVASASALPHVVEKGFEGADNHLRWLGRYGARLICPPKRNAREVWFKPLRRWVAGIRQIVENAYDKLFTIPSTSGGSDLISFRGCERVWRQG